MNIGFHANQLDIRGTEVALFDYALFNQTLLGNNSYIFIQKTSTINPIVYKKFSSQFNNIIFYDTLEDISKYNLDMCYFIKSGENDGKLVKGCKNCVHAVFQVYQPHGDVYAYVSKWLSQTMRHPFFVPHMVNLPSPNFNLREKLGLGDHIKIIGRYGGYKEFDIEFVKQEVVDIASKYNDIVFLFMNTEPFANMKNIIFIQGTSDLQHKANFIHTCDAMIHARREGESFGLAIAEFLTFNKPVYAWNDGIDKNHIEMLDSKYLYSNKKTLNELLLSEKESIINKNIDSFTPINVMHQFKKVFLT